MKKPRKPKMGKMPKAKSSGDVWKSYYEREQNKQKEYNAKLKEFERQKAEAKMYKEKARKLRLKTN